MATVILESATFGIKGLEVVRISSLQVLYKCRGKVELMGVHDGINRFCDEMEHFVSRRKVLDFIGF